MAPRAVNSTLVRETETAWFYSVTMSDGREMVMSIPKSALMASMGRKGGSVKGPSKRRDVDYAALGRKGGLAGKGASKARK